MPEKCLSTKVPTYSCWPHYIVGHFSALAGGTNFFLKHQQLPDQRLSGNWIDSCLQLIWFQLCSATGSDSSVMQRCISYPWLQSCGVLDFLACLPTAMCAGFGSCSASKYSQWTYFFSSEHHLSCRNYYFLLWTSAFTLRHSPQGKTEKGTHIKAWKKIHVNLN